MYNELLTVITCNIENSSLTIVIKIPGDYGEGEPPVPIPNTAVKPLSADGTCRVTGWESKSLPGVILIKRSRI